MPLESGEASGYEAAAEAARVSWVRRVGSKGGVRVGPLLSPPGPDVPGLDSPWPLWGHQLGPLVPGTPPVSHAWALLFTPTLALRCVPGPHPFLPRQPRGSQLASKKNFSWGWGVTERSNLLRRLLSLGAVGFWGLCWESRPGLSLPGPSPGSSPKGPGPSGPGRELHISAAPDLPRPLSRPPSRAMWWHLEGEAWVPEGQECWLRPPWTRGLHFVFPRF